ncbi:methionine--tRNA ligase [Paenibacillus ginsengarvi]|uniref:Methionine--tRNA ligase n=1 Tax=Paenibacillus ginsengarvi TaxID=400777 RepID=A0A3B0CK36_9BACL|nr:methionine--tRNA ligase [Paenibacillus ginsengarvi]RKN85562.1 methionine--tRNA ligase [Paenibacillus ginsengarvi]
MAHIFIGGAWPYANGSLHLGRLASLLPGDVLARYFRAKGDDVLYVSGSDCHGTPVAVQALQEGVPPSHIADRYHREFADCFERLGFTYDLYTRTDQPFHHRVVQELFLKLLDGGHLYKQTMLQTYCETDRQFLPDRYVEGTCPVCGNRARGDQCDYCSTLLDPADLSDKTCKLCGNRPVERPTEHYYIALSRFQQELSDYAGRAEGWRDNAVRLTRRYLEEGLPDRAVTRDLSWGVDVPVEGFEGKKIYVWIEAVSGYWSASRQWAEESGRSWEPFWSKDAGDVTAYYVHGKDNVPFHSLIWPALLLGAGDLHLPDKIVSCEYMTLEGKKISTSRNWAVWVPDVLSRYDPDSIRYFLIANGPEKRDTDFSWREFIYSHNGELLGAFGNFVNRTLAFIAKSFGGRVPPGTLAREDWESVLTGLYAQAGQLIEDGQLKDALELIFAHIRRANKYFDERKPWVTFKEDRAACEQTLFVCVQVIANLANLLEPFLPFACAKIQGFLRLKKQSWQFAAVPAGLEIGQLELLFERIAPERIEEETRRLTESTSASK